MGDIQPMRGGLVTGRAADCGVSDQCPERRDSGQASVSVSVTLSF